MVSFCRLTVRNFKRYAGNHEIPLMGDGRVTVIAAENGVGKTTTMDAIHIALYGKRGFEYLYPKDDFEKWLDASYSVDGEGDRHIFLALEMEDPILGSIRISRTYWLLSREYGGLEEEVGIEVSGKPLEREAGESRVGLAERWLEDYLPHSAMRKFLVDGERLSHLDPKRIDDEIVRGMDDVIGIGLLHRMRKRLESVGRRTLKSLTPTNQEETLDQVLALLSDCEADRVKANRELANHEARVVSISDEISWIQDEIGNLTKAGGSESIQLRMQYAVRQSELTSARREIHQHLMGSLPFVIAGVPKDLQEWSVQEVLDAKASSERAEENLNYLRSAVDESGVGERTGGRIIRAGQTISGRSKSEEVQSPLSNLPLDAVGEVVKRHAFLGLGAGQFEAIDSLEQGILRLEAFEEAEQDLREATIGSGIGDKAEELRLLATELGSIQAEIARLRGEIEQCDANKSQIEAWIDKLKQNDDPESLLNRRLARIGDLERLCDLVIASVRRNFAEPLESAFSEGFDLLSRKSGKLEGVSIDTADYSTRLYMRGFEGNWLDRGLSATERQHVGLSLVYALRRASTRWSLPLPVVVDTPTSRMDRQHKSWSVTKFYPQLSNQVVVFATSDDLADGLFEELLESGALGLQLLIREVSDNSVEVVSSDLSAFFRG